MFIGRQHELNELTRAIESDRPELGIIYGRRRVGKSALIQQAAERSDQRIKTLIFEGLQEASKNQQITHFLTQLAKQTSSPLAHASNWNDAFSALEYHIKTGRYYVVFDELPWMANGKTDVISLIKFFWDNRWKRNEQVTLILCGSIAQFMIRHVLHSKALHNRKTFEIRLDPLPAKEAREFFKGYRSDLDIARFLMVFGGIPKYLEQLDPKVSLSKNLDRLVFNKSGYFLQEFETIFKEQFKVIKTYEKIVRILSKHSLSIDQLAKSAGITPGGGFGYYLESLQQADFVNIETPVSFSGKRSRTRRVSLTDPWLRFYFQYVEPHKDTILLNSRPGMFSQLVEPTFASWCGISFERLCLQNLVSLLDHMEIPLHEIVGFGPFFRQPLRKSKESKASGGVQIDLLLHRKNELLTLIECKFKGSPVGTSVIDDVERKLTLLNAPKSYTVERVLIAPGGVTKGVTDSEFFHKVLGIEAIYDGLD